MKKVVSSVIGLLTLFIFYKGFSQNNRIIPPSPEAAALGKFGDIPVSNYTGIPSISIPLYSLKAGDFELPISLDYHASGIKVEEEAGWVGLGWALRAGGIITRTIKGLDDLGVGGYPFAPEPNISSENYLKSVAERTNDSEPDIFYYSFGERSGKFFLKQGESGEYNGNLLKQEKLKIIYNPTTRGWTIVSEEGIKYIFSVEETTIPHSGIGPDPATAIINLRSTQSSVSAWHLSEIILKDGNKIVFEYSNSNPIYFKSIPSINQELTHFYDVLSNIYSCGDLTTGVQYLAYRSIHQGIYLRKIHFGETTIDFISEDREDLEPQYPSINPRRLKEISINSFGGNIKSIFFTYNYFNSNHINNYQKRLKLSEIRESNGSVSINPYKFEYYDSPNYAFELPDKNSASRDLWGFFNGKNNSSITSTFFNKNIENCLVPPILLNLSTSNSSHIYRDSGSDRSPDNEATRLGILTKITYPTGGSSEFEYEAHDYHDPWDELIGQIQNIQLFRYGPLVENPPTNMQMETELDFSSRSTNTTVSIYAAIYCNNYQEFGGICINRGSYYGDIYKIEPNNSQTLFTSIQINSDPNYTLTQSDLFDYSLPPGKYILRVYNPGDAWVTQLQVSYQLVTNIIQHQKKIAGGVRVKEIRTKSSAESLAQIRRYIYDAESLGSSSGLLMNKHTSFYYLIDEHFMCEGGEPTAGFFRAVKRRSWSNSPLGSGAHGNHVGYGIVTVINGQDGENGKSIYRYSNDEEWIDTSLNIPDETMLVPNHNGLLLSSIDYKKGADQSYLKIKEVQNIYEEKYTTSFYINGLTMYPVDMYGEKRIGVYKQYQVRSDKWDLKQSITRLYESELKYNETITDYFYENSNHLQLTKQRTTQSDGSILETIYKYPLDYQSVSNRDGGLTWMIDNNIVNAVIEKRTIRERGSERKVVDMTANTFRTYPGDFSVNRWVGTNYTASNLMLLPYKTYGFKSASPLSESGSLNYNGQSPDISLGNYRELLKYVSYDGKGNPLEIQIKGDEYLNYIWGYKGVYPVAEIRNASASAVNSAISAAGTNRANLYNETNSGTMHSYLSQIRSNSNLSSSLVSSYTYKPLVGMSSSTDPSGKQTWYNYDSFGRLSDIRENSSNGNLIKSFTYRYAGGAASGTGVNTSVNIGAVAEPSLSAGSCTAPAAPTINITSGTTVCAANNQQVTLSASACDGVVTWYKNGGEVASNTSTITRNDAGSYTATCTFNGCTSQASAPVVVQQTSGCTGTQLDITLSIWRAGVSGVRTKVKDLVEGDQILLSSFGGNQANWFIKVDNGQVNNSFGADYYNHVQLHMTLPNGSINGWGPSDVHNSDGGPFGLYGRDDGTTPSLGAYQIRGKAFNGSTELASKTINFSIVTSTECDFTPSLSSSNQSPASGSTFTLTAGCTGSQCTGITYTWSGNGVSGTGSSKTVTAPASGTYTYTITASKSGCSDKTASVSITVPSTGGGGTGTGLTGTYFNNKNLQDPPVLTRIDPTINFNWGAGSPGTGINIDMFSVRWEGQVEAPVTGTYIFKTNDDDGSRLWVNGQQLIDNWIDQGADWRQGSIYLTAGQKYNIKKEYFDSGGGAESRLYWEYPGQSEQIVPQNRLYPTTGCTLAAPSLTASPSDINEGGSSTLSASGCSGTITWSHGLGTGTSKTVSPASTTTYTATCTLDGCVSAAGSVTVTVTPTGGGGNGTGTGLTGTYFNNMTFEGSPALTRIDPTIDFDWGGGPPGSGVNIDMFSVRWEGQVEAPVTGTYIFKTNDDDGSRLWVNGQLLIDDWLPHGPTPMQGNISLTAGQKYNIKKEYFDSGGGAESRLYWQYSGQSEQVVPQNRLYPTGCTPPSAPSLTATPASINQGSSSSLSASGCSSGTITWSHDLGTGTSKTVSPASTTTYTATCTLNGCTSAAASVTVTVIPPGGGTGTGLTGTYFNNMTFEGSPALTRIDPTIDFDWGGGSPGSGVNIDMFSVRWEGQVEAPVTGTYIFKTNDDDGSRLWVNGQLLIDDWLPHGPTPMQGNISLTAGQKYNIKKEYFDSGGGAESRLYWQYPGQSEQVVPQSRLYPTTGCTLAAPSLAASPSDINEGGSSTLSASGCSGTITWSHGLGTGTSKTVSPSSTTTYTATCTLNGCVSAAGSVTVTVTPTGGGGNGTGTGLTASYFNNMAFEEAPVLTRIDPTINFNWGEGSPGSGVNDNMFSVRWEGQVEAPVTGTYIFKTNDDDGSRLWVNGQLLIDDWVSHSATPRQGSITLTGGQKYSIKKEYFESVGEAESRLYWQYPGQSEQVVPQNRLYPTGN